MAIITKGKAQQTLVASIPTGFSFADASTLTDMTAFLLLGNGVLSLPTNSQVNVVAFPNGVSGTAGCLFSSAGALAPGSATIFTSQGWNFTGTGPSCGYLVTTGAA